MVILGKSYYLEITFSNFVWLFYTKIITMFHRIWDIVRWLPLRLKRIGQHIYRGCFHFIQQREQYWKIDLNELSPLGIAYWWLELSILILSLIGVAEIYETITDFTKFNTRSLSNWEKKLVKSVYGETINYNRVRLDSLGLIGPRQFHLSYVSFYTINTWGSMPNHVLIHEMMHIWQYQKMGAVYIPRALAAQNSAAGYNYGGVAALQHALNQGKGLQAFNLEQQADIIMDYYLIREGYRPQWGNGNRFDLPIYESFLDEVKA